MVSRDQIFQGGSKQSGIRNSSPSVDNGDDCLDIELVALALQFCRTMSLSLNLIEKKRNGAYTEDKLQEIEELEQELHR